MKLNSYSRFIVVLTVSVFALNLPVYVAVDLRQAFPSPYHWAFGLALLSVPMLIRRDIGVNLLRSPLMVWCFGFIFVTIAGFFHSPQSEVEWKEIILRCVAVFEMAWLFLLCADLETIKLSRIAVGAATLINVALNIYEFFYPETFSTVRIVEGRSAGLHGNPNQAADALVMGMVFCTTLLPFALRWPFMILIGIATLLTFSRSGIVEWVVVAAAFMLAREVGVKEVLTAIFVGVLVFVTVFLPFGDQILMNWDKTVMRNRDLMERLNWLTSPTEVVDYSGLERAYVAKQSWERIAEQPWLGHGTGTSARAYVGTHNVYLAFMEDYGLLGVAVLPLLVLAATWGAVGEVRLIAILFACTMLWQGFFSHAIINNEVRTLMVSMMAAMVWVNREQPVRELKPSGLAETWVGT
jgi:hypothetical protein